MPGCERLSALALALGPGGARLLALVLAVGAAAAVAGCRGAEAPRPVLLVVLDTVRADRTSAYGYARPTTIQMEAVARAGVVFEEATAAASWTYPSHASLFTGEPPWVHGAHLTPLSPDEAAAGLLPVSALRPELPTLAERFRDAGYSTAAVVANAWLRPEIGLMRGFEYVYGHAKDGEVVAHALEQIRRDREQPLFLFVNLNAAHMPYRDGPGPWAVGLERGESVPAWARPYLTGDDPVGLDLAHVAPGDEGSGLTRFASGELAIPPEGLHLLGALYDAGVRAADFSLGRIVEAWSVRFPDGIVAVTSDHGEALGEHGQIGHAASVFPEVLHVPLVLAAPGLLPAGVRVASPAGLTELPAALLYLARPGGPEPSLLARIEGDTGDGLVTSAAWPEPSLAERAGGRFRHTWQLARNDRWALAGNDKHAELYDLATDPSMERDVAARHPERVAELRRRAAPLFERAVASEAAPVRVTAETRRQLRALGYLHP